MIIKAHSKDYEVKIEQDFAFVHELKNVENGYFIIDKNIYDIYPELFSDISGDKCYILEALETNKTIDSALEICEIMTGLAAKRNIHLVSFGGGIIQDVTGFVANVLYRGIYWSFVPTTLLAACDSCIGGKTSLNYKQYKNLLGTFYPPDNIYICSKFFKSLSQKDFESGLGEVVKFNIMFGEKGLTKIENKIDDLLQREPAVLDEFVNNSLLFKKVFIEEDEYDRGIRIHLNFAHTFGHAYEVLSNYAIPHGTAVAIGMITANRISLSRKWLTEDIVLRSESVLKKIIHISLENLVPDIDNMIKYIRKDKKQTNTDITAVLMEGNMSLKIVKDVSVAEIKLAMEYVFDLLKK